MPAFFRPSTGQENSSTKKEEKRKIISHLISFSFLFYYRVFNRLTVVL